jgi:hypothetical protein
MRDLKNIRFGKLVGIKPTNKRSSTGGIIWSFLCNCGNISEHEASRVFKGNIKSCGCSRRSKDPNKSLIKSKYQDYKDSAKVRGINFHISFEFFKNLVQKPCHYCGSIRDIKRHQFSGKFTGIDRVDSSLGYSDHNCVSCCNICNRAKRDISYIEFKTWIKRLIDKNK